MKKFIKFVLVLSIGFSLLIGSTIYAVEPLLPKDFNHESMQVFAPTSIITVSNGSLDVSNYEAIMFAADVTIQINGTGLTFPWPANTPYGIGNKVTALIISGLGSSTTALVM